MLREALNKSRRPYTTNKELYGTILLICTSIIQQRLRFSGYCWRVKAGVFLWELSHGKCSPARPNKTYIIQSM